MVEDCSHKAVVESSSLSISTVLVAQLARAGILYIQGQGFKSLCEYYLGVPEWSKGTDCKSDDSWVQITPSLCVI